MFRMAGSHGLIGAAWLAALGAAAGRGDCPIFVVREWGGGLTAL